MITTVLAIALLLGICVFVHELGHFLAGKLVGVQPRVFSIGYGRGLFFKKKGRTIYQVTAIPLGGYVQFYGDDITKDHSKIKEGDFFSVGPWRRIIIAFAGPFFSILFGFILIFILLLSGWRPTANEINVGGEDRKSSAALAGLVDGDKILEVNGIKTDYFEKVNLNIALSGENNIHLKIQRGSEIIEKNINATAMVEGGPLHIDGIEPRGEKFLVVKKGKFVENTFLKDSDRIVTVNGEKADDIYVLRNIVNRNIDKKVEVVVEREQSSLFNPNKKERLSLLVPVQSHEYFRFYNIKDLQTEKIISEIEIGQWDEKSMYNIFINNRSFVSWNDFRNEVVKVSERGRKPVKFRIGPVQVESRVEISRRGLLGISLETGVNTEKMEIPAGIISLAALTIDFSVVATKSTLLGLYRIIEGKLSFRKSISGPVKIMKMTAQSIKIGWDVYWLLFAQITIVLGIMNLLPIPVLDGGHILMYFIEGVYKPIPTRIIAAAMRIGVVLLIGLGIYVIFLDIWDVFIAGLF
jgi:regulator of sigma E protease